jgi:hypothetical protein
LLGNVSLVSGYAAAGGPASAEKTAKAAANRGGGSRHRFASWQMSGDAFTVSPAHRFGPLLWSMYSLSDSRTAEGFVMKLSALTGPMGTADSQVVELQVQRDGRWQSLGEAKLDPDAWVATFRIPRWNEKRDTPYKLVYREKHRDGTVTPDEWTGTILANPAGRPLRLAAMTCQNDYGFPYEPVARNVAKLKPDLVFFSGDQIYESHGGFGIVREPAELAILNYLRKFYQFGWAFRDVMRHAPTLCIPDDHDVFHGNIWGEGGAKMATTAEDRGASSTSGYIQPARMVNAVHRTNVSRILRRHGLRRRRFRDSCRPPVEERTRAGEDRRSAPRSRGRRELRLLHARRPGPRPARRAAGRIPEKMGGRLARPHAQGRAEPDRLRLRRHPPRQLRRLLEGRP